MILPLVFKRSLHNSTPFKCRGPVTQQGWFPRDHMPGRYPRTEEERRAAAIKYGLRPEDYTPYDPDDVMNHMGDYPDVGVVTAAHKDPYDSWSDQWFRRNWGEPMTRQSLRYRPERWTYNGLDEEQAEFVTALSRYAAIIVPLTIIYLLIHPNIEEIRKYVAYVVPNHKQPNMPKQYPYDYYRAFPYENPLKYPILNYTFEPAEKCDPEGDNARFPFNESER